MELGYLASVARTVEWDKPGYAKTGYATEKSDLIRQKTN